MAEQQKQRASFNEVQRFIKDCHYPCSKEELLTCAQDHQAPYPVMRTLQVMRHETKYDDIDDVKEGVEEVLHR